MRDTASLSWWGLWWLDLAGYRVTMLTIVSTFSFSWESYGRTSVLAVGFHSLGKDILFKGKTCNVFVVLLSSRLTSSAFCALAYLHWSLFYVAWWDSILQVRLCVSAARNMSVYSVSHFAILKQIGPVCINMDYSLFGFCSWDVFVDFQVDSRGEHSSWVLLRKQNHFLYGREPSHVLFCFVCLGFVGFFFL